MSTITINSDIYQKAERYAKLNNINLLHLIEKFLMKLQTPSAKENAALALPDHRRNWQDAFLMFLMIMMKS